MQRTAPEPPHHPAPPCLEPLALPGDPGPEDAAAPARGCSVLWGCSLEQLQRVSFWCHTELNLEQVLWDQWRCHHLKPLYRKGDYPRPDVTFCSHCLLLHGVGMAVCTFLSFYCALVFTLASAWGSRRSCYNFLVFYLVFQEVSFIIHNHRPGTFKHILLK